MRLDQTFSHNTGWSKLEINHGPANAVNDSFLTHINTILDQVPDETPLLITGKTRFFSSGLDLKYCSGLCESEFSNFITGFQDLLLRILNRPGLNAGLIQGHAVAGGFILASALDTAFVCPGDFHLGMNEKQLGIRMPPVPTAIFEYTYPGSVDKILGRDRFYSPHQILSFTNFISIENGEIEEIIKPLEKLMNDEVLLNWKSGRKDQIHEYLTEHHNTIQEAFLSDWWSENAVSRRNTAVNRLNDRRKNLEIQGN